HHDGTGPRHPRRGRGGGVAEHRGAVGLRLPEGAGGDGGAVPGHPAATARGAAERVVGAAGQLVGTGHRGPGGPGAGEHPQRVRLVDREGTVLRRPHRWAAGERQHRRRQPAPDQLRQVSPPSERQFRASPRRTPAILQMEAVECGAAALAIVLAYYGRWVSLEQLRVDCGVTRDGSRASNMVKAARSYGLQSRGRRLETEDLGTIALPVIVFWNFNHFVVVEGANRRGVWINDPAIGRRHVAWREFDEAFTGIVLTFTPGPDFTPGGEEPSLVRG